MLYGNKRAVENPFKERRLPFWVRYAVIAVGFGLILGWCLLGGNNGRDSAASSSWSGSSSAHDPSHLLLRKPQISQGGGVENNDNDEIENEIVNEIENENEIDDGNESQSQSGSSDEDGGEKSWNGPREEAQHEVADDWEENMVDRGDDMTSEKEEGKEFPSIEQDEFFAWIRSYYNALEFYPAVEVEVEDGEESPSLSFSSRPKKLTKSLLTESLVLGCEYIARNQKEETGNFNYQYDFVTDTMDENDSPVRQAGALWGMTLCFQSMPDNASYRTTVERGIAFFRENTVDGPPVGSEGSSRMVVYPGFEDESPSGVNALYGLALVDYLVTLREHPATASASSAVAGNTREIETELAGILRFLTYLRLDNGHFAELYDVEAEEKSDNSSPYYDGETMLCLVKAARYLGKDYEHLVPLIERTAPVLAKAYTVDAWRTDEHDSSLTKGFYQWSSMVFQEYYAAGWKDYESIGDCLLVLAHWIVHTHEILGRTLNTGYAFEGIVSAYRVAEARGHTKALSDLGYTIDEGLYKLTGWQVGGPLAHTNSFLVSHPTDERIAIGGIMNAEDEAPLRIDTTQHQMHAVMMALETLFATTNL